MIFKVTYGVMMTYLTLSILWHRLVLHRIPGQISAVLVYTLIFVNALVLAWGFRGLMLGARQTKMEKS
jgi:hypothetical protein